MKLWRPLAVAFVLLATAFATLGALGSTSHAVVGGSAAGDGEFPFMASVQDGSGFAFCGGTVISSRWVLTAAHCVTENDGSDLYVVTGRANLNSSTGQRIKVAAIHTHPSYRNNTHDAALLRLSSRTRSPAIRLASNTAADDAYEAAGTRVTVTGWGDQLPTLGLFSSAQLRKVDLEVVSDAECGQTNIGFHAATGVCAAALLKDSCQGDSGGPLFATEPSGARVQIGIVSYGMGCALPKFPGVYSEVNNAAIRSWITSVSGV